MNRKIIDVLSQKGSVYYDELWDSQTGNDPERITQTFVKLESADTVFCVWRGFSRECALQLGYAFHAGKEIYGVRVGDERLPRRVSEIVKGNVDYAEFGKD